MNEKEKQPFKKCATVESILKDTERQRPKEVVSTNKVSAELKEIAKVNELARKREKRNKYIKQILDFLMMFMTTVSFVSDIWKPVIDKIPNNTTKSTNFITNTTIINNTYNKESATNTKNKTNNNVSKHEIDSNHIKD